MSVPQPRYRVDGVVKVAGMAQFGADFPLDRIAYGVLILSTIPKGRILRFDTSAAVEVPGVLKILTPANALPLPNKGVHPELKSAPAIALLQDDLVHYNGQAIGLAVAESLESAQWAASLVEVEYQTEPAQCDFMAGLDSATSPKDGGEAANYNRGDLAGALQRSDVIVEEIYSTPVQNHNPMEPHATIAHWNGAKLLVYEPSQWIMFVRTCMATWFGLPEGDVRVLGPYVGGGFGGKGAVWSHAPLAVMAAKILERPVKISLDRRQMYTITASRPRTLQKLTLGATRDGKLLAVRNDVKIHSSPLVELVEDAGTVTHYLYETETNATSHRMVSLNVGPTWVMRAPGEATGSYALETGMDELAYRLNLDPLVLRLKNYAEGDASNGKPYSQKLLRDCYARGAERFGWNRRNPEPRSMREGNVLLGMGMATATYPAYRAASSAIVRLRPDGRVFVGSATHEIGTGTYTVLAQIASDSLGIGIDRIEVKTGDTNLPPAIYSGGSLTVATVGSAVHAAAENVRQKVIELAVNDPQSNLYRAAPEQIVVEKGRLRRTGSYASESYEEILSRHGYELESTIEAKPGKEIDSYSTHSFGAVFAEVAVDLDFYTVHVRRFTGVYDIGRLMNHKAGINQLSGGAIWGISMALFEGAVIDTRYGRIVNSDLSEYHLPTNADIGDMDISVLDAPDFKFNPMGARGIGEIGVTGAAAAVANAVYHATGKRVRDLPITIDKLAD